MKVYEKKIATTEREVFQGILCDICGSETVRGTWAFDPYSIDEVTIKHRCGSNFPEGGMGQEIEVDLCPECFDDKLVPWLRNQGARVIQTEWDW